MINKYDFLKLLHDLKRISRLIPILRESEDKKTREQLCTVIFDELQRLQDDLEEIKNSNEEEPKNKELN